MSIKQISIRANESTVKFLESNYPNATQGLTSVAEAFQYIRMYSIREIRGMFTAQEWCYLADALNGTIVTPEFRCNHSALIASIEDSRDFNNLHLKWDVEIESFIDRVSRLTGAQTETVFAHVEKFWNDENRNLESWSKEI